MGVAEEHVYHFFVKVLWLDHVTLRAPLKIRIFKQNKVRTKNIGEVYN